jgi:hypothetical protein
MARKPPAHTGGFGGFGNMTFPGGSGGGGGGGSGQHHKRAHHHKHTGGFGGWGNTKFPGGGKGGKKPPQKPGKTVKRAGHHPKRHLAGPSLAGWWITGGNDVADNCAAVAVANSLLAATGRRIPDADLLRLHDRAGPLSIAEALAALGAASFTETTAVSEGTVIGVATPYGPHAALWTGGGLVTWGRWTGCPDDWQADEAWAVTW